MLYNTNWAKTHNDVFSLESLIAWLEKQPSRENYDFFCQGACMLGQWIKNVDPLAKESPPRRGEEPFHYLVFGERRDFTEFNDIAQGFGIDFDWTFGAALDRARKALAER